MKNGLFPLLILAGLLAGCWGGEETASRVSDRRPLPPPGDPYPVLDTYGTWIDGGPYGQVWQPAVPPDWRPYTNGEWVWTDRGWMWESDEPFGWVVYHYGYWTELNAAGWVWVPGNEWSPARVQWYSRDEYVGWAPMPPPQASFPEAYQSGSERVWVVVPAREFTRRNVGQYRTGTPPPPPAATGRSGAIERPPDVNVIVRATNQPLKQRSTEKDDVRNGPGTVTRVRVRQEEEPRSVPPGNSASPPSSPAPVPAPVAQPAVVPEANTTVPVPAVKAKPARPRSQQTVKPAPKKTPASTPGDGDRVKKQPAAPDKPQPNKETPK